LDAGPAVHQNAGLARYTERLAYHLYCNHAEQVDLTLFYNAHSGHTLPETLHTIPQQPISMGQYAWRLSVLASQILRQPFYERTLPAQTLYHAAEHLLPSLRRPTVLTIHASPSTIRGPIAPSLKWGCRSLCAPPMPSSPSAGRPDAI
jgi:hypothetical protein